MKNFAPLIPNRGRNGRQWRRVRWMALSVTLVLLGGRVTHAAGVVFADGFEDGTVKKWSPMSDHNVCAVVSTSVDNTPPHSGSYMAECNWNGTVPWNDPASFSMLGLSSWPYSSEFLIRVWVRMASDVAHVNGSKILRLFPNGGTHDQIYMQAYMGETPQYLFHDWLLNDVWQKSYWGDGTAIGDGAWHKIEIYVKQNDPGVSNGVVRNWKDGRLQQEFTNLMTIAPGDRWSGLSVMSNWSTAGHGANNHVEWDDIEIYSDLGVGASGSMSDASITSGSPPAAVKAPPKSPSGVLVK